MPPRRALAALLLAAGAALAQGPAAVPVIEADEEVTLGLAAYTRRALAEAKGAPLAVLRLDTFGGRVDAALQISRQLETTGTRVVAWVDDKAWSAGALLALSTKRIYMTKSASIGSAQPVASDGEKTEALGEKHVSALRAKFRALAERNGYPEELAAAMVDREHEVVRGKVDGKDAFLTPGRAERLRREGKVQGSTETVNAKGKLLNLTGAEAVEFGLASPAETAAEVLAAEGLAGAAPRTVAKSPVEKFVNVLTGSTAASLLVLFGLMLLSAEMNLPGGGWLGAAGLLCLALVFGGHYLADMAEWIDLVLIAAGLALFAVEAFVLPGFGAAGLLGIVCLLGGLYFMLVPFLVPVEPWEFDRFKEALWVLAAALAGSIVGLIALFAAALRRLPMFHPAGQSPEEGPIAPGRRGLAVTALAPEGRVQFGIHIVDVRAEGPEIPKGVMVEAVKAGPPVVVRRLEGLQ